MLHSLAKDQLAAEDKHVLKNASIDHHAGEYGMYPKTVFSNSLLRQRSGKCFVIMPFAPAFDGIYETIRDALVGPELSFTCSRADDLQRGGHIFEDVFQEIAESEIIIADLTNRNPNVFYELGIVQMVKDVEKVILLSQDADSIPFDVRDFRCIIYEASAEGARELKDSLISYVKAGADTSFRFKLPQNGSYQFPHKLMGLDACAYDFTVRKCLLLFDGAKFQLCVKRHVVDETPAVVFDDTLAVGTGNQYQLPNIEWDIQLDKVDGGLAQFVVLRRAKLTPRVTRGRKAKASRFPAKARTRNRR